MSIFLDIMKEELERNRFSQQAFNEEISKFPKGYLSVCNIGGKSYVYRKRREGNKIVSEYIGVVGDQASQQAEKDRKEYLSLVEGLKNLKKDEKRLKEAIRAYEKL